MSLVFSMKKYKVVLFIAAVGLLLPSAAMASNPMILFYIMGLQAFSWIWPFVLPLFYLRAAPFKLGLYLLLMMVPLGILELTDTPLMIYYNLAGWGLVEDVQAAPPFFIIGRELLALGLSLWFLPRIRRLMLAGYESRQAAQQATESDNIESSEAS